MTLRAWSLIVCLTIAGVAESTAADTDRGKAGPLVRELTTLLQQKNLDSVAARHAEHDDRFVAALLMPGQELIVVSAQYPAPALLREKILLGRYRDAYMDLYASPAVDSKRLVEDLRADGISAERVEGQPFDIYTRGTAPFAFDGAWKKRKLREEEYLKVFGEADTEYATMLQTLIAHLKIGPTP
jgi:hypothetical protein